MQQELGAREQTVAAMKASGDIPAAHLEELENTWDRVNHLADIREGRLRESLKLVSTVDTSPYVNYLNNVVEEYCTEKYVRDRCN